MQTIVILCLIVIAVLSRLLPHPPNFAPIGAIALFSGALFTSRTWSMLAPLLIMFISDLILGLHTLIPTIYALFLLTTLIGNQLRDKITIPNVMGASLLSSILFFIGSNFMVWLGSTYYSQDLGGLIHCYVMAIPFFHWTVLGDLFYSGVLFSAWYGIKDYVTENKI